MASTLRQQHSDLITPRLLDAAVEVLALETPLTRELAHHLVDKSSRLARARSEQVSREASPSVLAGPEAAAVTFVHCIVNELRLRGVPQDAIDAVVADLDDLHRSVQLTMRRP